MPIHPTFNCDPKVVVHLQIITNPPLCFMVSWTCCGQIRLPSPIQHHDLPFELNLFIFVALLIFDAFPIINNPIRISLSKPQGCKNMFTTQTWFLLWHLCTKSTVCQTTPNTNSNLPLSEQSCFAI